MFKAITIFLVTVGVMALGGGAALAQSSQTFLEVPTIQGGSIHSQHAGWIDVLSLRQTWPTAGDKKKCAVEIVKPLDIAGPRLWAAAVTGQLFPEITIEVARATGEQQVYYTIKLTNAFISSISTAGEDIFAASLTIGAGAATLSYRRQRPDGTLEPPVTSAVSCS